jgi:hypothetical protein
MDLAVFKAKMRKPAGSCFYPLVFFGMHKDNDFGAGLHRGYAGTPAKALGPKTTVAHFSAHSLIQRPLKSNLTPTLFVLRQAWQREKKGNFTQRKIRKNDFGKHKWNDFQTNGAVFFVCMLLGIPQKAVKGALRIDLELAYSVCLKSSEAVFFFCFDF